MEENKIKQKIKEVQDIYVSKYPNGLGVYKVDDDSISVGYLYESNDDRWHTNTSDVWYPVFDPVEHVYNVFAKGYMPFYISDNVHAECWKETYEHYEDPYDAFIGNHYHGRRAYFQYCKEHGVDARYIQQIADYDDISLADVRFNNFESILTEQINEKLKECDNIDPITFKNYTYMLNEPCYQELEFGYTLENRHHEYVSFFSYAYDCWVRIKGEKYPDVFDLSDWGFDVEVDLFQSLKEGSQIKFMSIDTHVSIMLELHEFDKEKYHPVIQAGINKYLKYSKRNHVEQLVPEGYQKMVKDVYKKYDIGKQKVR